MRRPGQGGNGENNGNGGNGGTIGSKTVQTQPQGVSTFNLGIKPKDPLVFHGWANEDVSTWVAKVSDFFYLTESHPTPAGSLRNYPPSRGYCRLVGCLAARALWSTSRRFSGVCCIVGTKIWEFNQGGSSQGRFM